MPKLETSVLLDKLLRAGALRPEDYLVLSRMERMIMATHTSQSSRLKASSSASGASSAAKMQALPLSNAAAVDMRRDVEPKPTLVIAKSGPAERHQPAKSQMVDHSLARIQQQQVDSSARLRLIISAKLVRISWFFM